MGMKLTLVHIRLCWPIWLLVMNFCVKVILSTINSISLAYHSLVFSSDIR